MSWRPAETISRSLWLVPSSRPPSNSCTTPGAVIAIHPETGAPSGAAIGTVNDAVFPASIVTVCLIDPEIAFEHDGVLARRQVGDGHRRDAARDAVDADARACGLGANPKLSERRRGRRQLDVLRYLRAGRDGDRHETRRAVAAELERMRARA